MQTIDQNNFSMQEQQKYETFEDFQTLSKEVVKSIFSHGFQNPTKPQQIAIPVLTSGKEGLFQTQSGTGKTAAFVISALQIIIDNPDKQVVIINHTRELCQQTYEFSLKLINHLKQDSNCEIQPCLCIPTQTGIQSKKLASQLKKNPQFICGTIGKIYYNMKEGIIDSDNVGTIIIDEFDKILYDFESQIKEIRDNVESQMCLFSATCDSDLIEKAKKEYFKGEFEVFILETDQVMLAGIVQFVQHFQDTDKEQLISDKIVKLTQILAKFRGFQIIVFFNQKIDLDNAYQYIEDNYDLGDEEEEKESGAELKIVKMHGGLQKDERQTNLQSFIDRQSNVLFTSDLLARGIDIHDIKLVVNFDFPQDVETYIHRIGRTGRHGKKGLAVTFTVGQEAKEIQKIAQQYGQTIKEFGQSGSAM